MRQAGLVVWQAHQIAKRMVAPGVTTYEIDKEIEAYFEKLGAEPLFKDYPHHNRGKPRFPFGLLHERQRRGGARHPQ